MTCIRRPLLVALALTAAVCAAMGAPPIGTSALAGVAPADLCKDTKMKASGKYHLDLLKAFGKNRKVTNVGKLTSDISKAESKITKAFTKAEWTGSGVSRECQTTDDVGTLLGELDTQADRIIALLDETPIPPCPAFLATGQTTAYGTGTDGDLELGVVLSYTDNGDGTIRDNNTGLIWEKKSDDGSIHDQDNTYTWCGVSCGTSDIMDGTISTTFLATLNGGGGFAGYTDWRIPNVRELQSIVDYEAFTPAVASAFHTGCSGGCTVTTCSCTAASFYWSSTTQSQFADVAWWVGFFNGDVSAEVKSLSHHARAVRGGS